MSHPVVFPDATDSKDTGLCSLLVVVSLWPETSFLRCVFCVWLSPKARAFFETRGVLLTLVGRGHPRAPARTHLVDLGLLLHMTLELS